MLSLGGVSPAPASFSITARQNPFPQISQFPNKTHNVNLSFLYHLPTNRVVFPILGQIRSGFSLFSLNYGKIGENSALEIDDFDEDDKGEFVPLRSMKKWLEEKPSGFGEGREYDTSVEDKLLDEIRQSREAQLANINKLKNTPQIPSSKNLENEAEAAEVPRQAREKLYELLTAILVYRPSPNCRKNNKREIRIPLVRMSSGLPAVNKGRLCNFTLLYLKYAFLGALRSAAQMVPYEVSIGLILRLGGDDGWEYSHSGCRCDL